MPLKHHTETALIAILAMAIGIAGIVTSLLPALPQGLLPWAIAMIVSIAYPLVLWPMLKRNRADYEFRFLHWFPLGMFVLWMLLQLLSPVHGLFVILNLGFFYLWSLPVIILGFVLLMLFSVHVLRRSDVRMRILSLLFAFFAVGGIVSEKQGWSTNMAQSFHRSSANMSSAAMRIASGAAGMFGFSARPGWPAVATTSQASSTPAVAQLDRTTLTGSDLMKAKRLPKSGPEVLIGMLAMMLLAGYSLVLQKKAMNL